MNDLIPSINSNLSHLLSQSEMLPSSYKELQLIEIFTLGYCDVVINVVFFISLFSDDHWILLINWELHGFTADKIFIVKFFQKLLFGPVYFCFKIIVVIISPSRLIKLVKPFWPIKLLTDRPLLFKWLWQTVFNSSSIVSIHLINGTSN